MRPYQHVTIVFYSVLAVLVVRWYQYGLSWWVLLIWILMYLHVLALGAIYISWNFYLPAYHFSNSTNEIALSFDDGPATETAAILDVLKEQNVPAAFFCIGKNVTAHPHLMGRIVAENHVAGNHSYSHGFNFDWQSKTQMIAELLDTNAAIYTATGKKPLFFRPPYGVTNPNLARAVRATHMYAIGWSLRSFDTKATDSELLLDTILKKLRGGDIILLHDSQAITGEILPKLIIRCREKGFTFVRPDKLLGLPPYE